MNEEHIHKIRDVDPCPAGDSDCTNLAEVKRLQLEVKELAAAVRTDELTRLFNFRYFTQALSLEMERTRRSGQPTCLIILDLDHFKAINDVHGHEVGNKVLSHISDLIRKTIRRLDIPCRYGGEEFTIVLPDTTLVQGVRFANRLRLIIENSPIQVGDARLGIEASFGVAVYGRGDQVSEQEFVEKVDGFLYMAKQEGRNRVCHQPFEKDGKEKKKTSS
ncbi:MAG: GGDEF domain-containing protein [Gammaproteobacteria bacterium]|jgi:diguanylate cyclase (GGDEF)-like protein|nr:GGDEF domain-containing protein [Gammaproteobacteria bacterium]MBT3860483.1 GGDEF domain-containing protein [Gammaproteobacteria bacterium]MBT3987932.1 GGDEF domain-containing protein [Gammaproteobacteria bacterium]MBT4256628.1 GGDEF domain-containing protein [Gammaproteobacteria bacterium]MBT4582459.1 GGDEF domain-containing protein [Gammaproteobacteria bacterium]